MFKDYIRLLVRSRRDARILGFLVLVMLVAAALEAIGVGLVMPFVAVVQDPATARNQPIFGSLSERLGATSNFGIISLAGLILVLMFLAKNAYVALSTWAQMRFIFSRLTRTCDELMRSYVSRPYSFFVQRSSPDLVRTVVTDATNVFQAGVPSFFVAVVESFTSIVIVGFLVYLEPVGVPLAGIAVGGAAALFFRYFRRTFTEVGAVARQHQGRMLTWAHQAFGGAKEMKVLGVEGYFLRSFHRSAEKQSDALRKQRLLMVVPRNALELFGVMGLVGVVLGVTARDVPASRLLPLLGALALAVVRLMPSAVRMLSTVNEMRFYAAGARAVIEDLDAAAPSADFSRPAPAPLPFERAITIQDLSFAYPEGERLAVEDANLTIAKGEAIGLVGASGAGKTTLVDLLLGILIPSSGTIAIDGEVLERDKVRRWQRLIGYIPQSVYLTDDTLRRNVAFGIDDDQIDDERLWSALETARLADFVRELPDKLDTVVGERGAKLSGGQRQRVGIARAIYFSPKVLVLDEATSALDGITEHEVIEAIEALRKDHTMIVIAHRLSTVRNSDRIVFMDQGRIVDVGDWSELISKSPQFLRLAQLSGAA